MWIDLTSESIIVFTDLLAEAKLPSNNLIVGKQPTILVKTAC